MIFNIKPIHFISKDDAIAILSIDKFDSLSSAFTMEKKHFVVSLYSIIHVQLPVIFPEVYPTYSMAQEITKII
jgi:hypothetical protein